MRKTTSELNEYWESLKDGDTVQAFNQEQADCLRVTEDCIFEIVEHDEYDNELIKVRSIDSKRPDIEESGYWCKWRFRPTDSSLCVIKRKFNRRVETAKKLKSELEAVLQEINALKEELNKKGE